jgi:hypothetical protein
VKRAFRNRTSRLRRAVWGATLLLIEERTSKVALLEAHSNCRFSSAGRYRGDCRSRRIRRKRPQLARGQVRELWGLSQRYAGAGDQGTLRQLLYASSPRLCREQSREQTPDLRATSTSIKGRRCAGLSWLRSTIRMDSRLTESRLYDERSSLGEPKERVGFEPTERSSRSAVFKTAAFNHSATSPSPRKSLWLLVFLRNWVSHQVASPLSVSHWRVLPW